MTDEQLEVFRSLQADQEKHEDEHKELRLKVEAELAQSGILDKDMVELVFKQQLEELHQKKKEQQQPWLCVAQGKEVPSRRRASSRSSSPLPAHCHQPTGQNGIRNEDLGSHEHGG